MSFTLNLKTLHSVQKSIIKDMCVAKPKATQFDRSPEPVFMFHIDRNLGTAILPLGMYKHFMEQNPNSQRGVPINIEFTGGLLSKDRDHRKRDQDVVMAQALKKIKERGTCLLALHTGFGKTVCAIYAITQLKLKTMILCKQSELHQQWIDSLKNFTNANVQIIKDSASSMVLDPQYDVYIMGIQKAGRASPDVFKDIGLLIIDEAHVVFAESYSRALLNFFPRYLLALSATPDRKDGLDKLFVPYFGGRDEFIIRREIKNFTVIKYNTGFFPEISYNYCGILDWTTVLNSLAYDPNRQKLAVKIAMSYPKEKILMLSRRVDEIKSIAQLLGQAGEKVATLYGTQKRSRIPPDFRILVASEAKAGVGFDDPSLTMLMLLTDSTDVRQFEGRIRQTDNIVVDLVDDFPAFENHWDCREAWYLQRGATIHVQGATHIDRRKGKARVPKKRLL